jgi:ketosteroid isomerase-like protein
MSDGDVESVLTAAATVVAAFGAHKRAEYFDCFASDATFVFHNVDRVLRTRAEYEAEWASWESHGFKVLGCQSEEGMVQMFGDTALFNHRVKTQLQGEGDSVITSNERETIVFIRSESGRWIAVHEHLSTLSSPVSSPVSSTV